MVSINLALLKRQLNKKIKERWFSYCWEAFKITKPSMYTILLKAEMLFNLERKKIPTAWSVLDVDTLTLFSTGIKSNAFIFEPTESFLLQKRQEAATGGVLQKICP